MSPCTYALWSWRRVPRNWHPGELFVLCFRFWNLDLAEVTGRFESPLKAAGVCSHQPEFVVRVWLRGVSSCSCGNHMRIFGGLYENIGGLHENSGGIVNCNGGAPLTPKIPSIFFTNFYSFWPTWRNLFLYQKSMRTWGSNCKILKLPCWTSTFKNYSSSFHGI
jgi:hypothetical protein